jgi:hypothetical protein
MARKIVLVQPVHDHDDRPAPGVVQPAVEGVVEPVVRRLPLGLRQRLLGLQRIVDDDEVGTAPGQHPTDRGGEPAALRRRLEFGHRLPLRRKAGGKELPVPVAGDDLPAIARQFVGQVLRVTHAKQLGARVVAQAPGRKADRGQVRLQVARRHVDDHAPAPAGADRLELCRDDVVVPAPREQGARVELMKAMPCEARKIGAQQRLVLVRTMGFSGRHASRRAL